MNTTTAATAAESFVEDYAYNRLGGAGREDSAKSAAFSAVISGGMGASFYAVGQAARNMCFVEGTMVFTAEGLVAIECIAVGDIVIATDPETGETTEKEVKNTFVNETEELAHVFVDGEEIVCTPGHKFYAPEKGWTSAIKLRAGDQLQLVNGEYVTIEKVQHELLEKPVKVYNFEVEDFHTYYVGTNLQVLVHNMCQKNSKITVGRWMSQSEYEKMVATGRVQVSPNGNTTYVASPADINAYSKQAKKGSIYVEFDVDASSVQPAGREGWAQIPGPDSLYDRLNQKKGLPPINDMPKASNIVVKGKKE